MKNKIKNKKPITKINYCYHTREISLQILQTIKDNTDKRRLWVALFSKFDNLDEMDEFLKKHNFQKWTQDETENCNSHLSSEKVEFIILKI